MQNNRCNYLLVIGACAEAKGSMELLGCWADMGLPNLSFWFLLIGVVLYLIIPIIITITIITIIIITMITIIIITMITITITTRRSEEVKAGILQGYLAIHFPRPSSGSKSSASTPNLVINVELQ